MFPQLKSAFYSLAFIATLVSCSEKDEPQIDLGAQVAGNYTITAIMSGGDTIQLPTPGVSIALELTRLDVNQANYKVTAEIITDKSEDTGTFSLRSAGSKIILTTQNQEVGFVEGKKITLSTVDIQGVNMKMEGIK